MDPVQQMAAALTKAFPPLWALAWKALLFLIIVFMFKRFADNIANYFLFRSAKQLGVGTKVRIDDKDAYIDKVTWRWINLRLKGGDTMLIPISEWQCREWVVKDFYKEIYKEDEISQVPPQ
jgi:hypothetical protein